MHIKSLLDFGSTEWETLYHAISELIPAKDARSAVFDDGQALLHNHDQANASFDVAKLVKSGDCFAKDGSVHHVVFDGDFMFGGWFPLNTMTTFCGVFMAKDGSLYYFGDGHVAANILEIQDNNWTVLGHHYPVAPIDTYFQLAAFLLFFTGQNELLNQRLEALFPFIGHGIEVGDPQPMTSELIDVAAVAKLAQWKTISSILDEAPDEDAAIPMPTNLERLEARTAELLEGQEEPQAMKTVLYDYNDPARKWALKAAGVVVVAAAGYGLYRFFRG